MQMLAKSDSQQRQLLANRRVTHKKLDNCHSHNYKSNSDGHAQAKSLSDAGAATIGRVKSPLEFSNEWLPVRCDIPVHVTILKYETIHSKSYSPG